MRELKVNPALLCALLAMPLAGASCQVVPEARTIVERGSAAADDTLGAAEFVLCRGITVGAWVRRYGENKQLAEAWRVLCGTPITETP